MTGHKKGNLLTMREGVMFIQYCISGCKYWIFFFFVLAGQPVTLV